MVKSVKQIKIVERDFDSKENRMEYLVELEARVNKLLQDDWDILTVYPEVSEYNTSPGFVLVKNLPI